MGERSKRGMAVVISGPSGSGKSAICSRLCARPGFRFSVSATTRAPRKGERHGVDYLFVTPEQFLNMRELGEILEFSEHFGNSYGTPRGPVEEGVAAGQVVVLDVDVNGADQVRRLMPKARSVFVLPPSPEELDRRLRTRDTEDEASLRTRLARAEMEMTRSGDFDLKVVNDDLDEAVDEILNWLESEASRSNGS